MDNPVIGSVRLNRLGLHAGRMRFAHALAWFRRGRLADKLSPSLRRQFAADGYIVIPNFMAPAEFTELQVRLLALDAPARSHQQGDTVTTRVAIGPGLLAAVPGLARLLNSSPWHSVLAYVASFRSRPLYYLQAVRTGLVAEHPDPQQDLHADTFHPSMKAWLFLNDVGEKDAPLTYVAGSHRLTPARLAWERAKSTDVLSRGDRLSQRGSLRVSGDELRQLGLPEPTRFVVPANTLVVIDTCGFHARGRSLRPSVRSEIWAYCRRSPFLPWTGLDVLSLPAIADRRAEWLAAALDWLDRKGWAKQHWKRSGTWREHVAKPASELGDLELAEGRIIGGRSDTAHAGGVVPRKATV